MADQGPGIPLELWERIFELFFQMDTVHFRKFSGTVFWI